MNKTPRNSNKDTSKLKSKRPSFKKNSGDFKTDKPKTDKSIYTERNSADLDKKKSGSRNPKSSNSTQYPKKERTFETKKTSTGVYDKSKTSKYSKDENFKNKRSEFSKGDNKPQRFKSNDDLIRLNKYIANSGICSRRDADNLIISGTITVNGKIVTEVGTKVKSTDKIAYNGELINNERKVYVLLNKPKDFITTTDDPQKRRTVLSLIAGACKERIYPVGRLDRLTTGVLLFTNDGDMAKRLTHPKHKIKKVYHVVLDKNFTKTDMIKIVEGIELEDGIVDVDKISYVADGSNKTEVGIELHSGKNRIVRRLFESLGYKVTKLDRVIFAGLTKKNIERGKWRFLSPKEVNFLKML